MKPFSLLSKSSRSKVKVRFLFPLAFCILHFAFLISPNSSLPAAAQTTDIRRAEAIRLSRLGIQQMLTGELEASIHSWEQALQIYRIVKDRQLEAASLAAIGFAYESLDNYAQATQYYQQQLAIARAAKDRSNEQTALNNLKRIYAVSDPAKVVEYYQQRLAIAREQKTLGIESYALSNLSRTYYARGDFANALKYAQQWLATARLMKDGQSEGAALGSLGIIYESVSEYGKAIEYAQQSLSIYRSLNNRTGQANALNKLGNVYGSLALKLEAIESYQQALSISSQSGERLSQAYALDGLGNLAFSLSQYKLAIEFYQQALPIFRQMNQRRNEASVFGHLGNAHSHLLQFDKAFESYQQALSISRQSGDRNGEAFALANLGTGYFALLQYDKATKFYQQALPITDQVGNRTLKGIVLNNFGATLFRKGEVKTAEKMLFEAIAVQESLRPGLTDKSKVSLFSEQSRTYRTLQSVLITQNKFVEALEVAERGRAKALVELLTQRFSSGTVTAKLGSPLNQSQIREIAKDQNATLVQYSVIYGDAGQRATALYIWVVQSTGEITFRQVDLKFLWQHNLELSDLVIGNQEFLAVRSRDPGSTKPRPDLPTLHQLLIDPIASLLPKDPNAHVIFIPQGSLFQVPFPALQDANGNYLIQKHTIRTAPSIQVLALTRQQQQKLADQPANRRGKALVLGNPTMPSMSAYLGAPKQPLSPLPGAEAEAKTIAPLLNTQAIIGTQGTKVAIVQKMPQASIIHFATHGLLDDVRGLGSAIALAPSGKDNGWLTAEEILNMKLQANLVVLSACNTGEGRITGDGVIGLSRSLIAAGVPSVIVSLWSVPDAPTAELMQAFYQNLQKNPDKAQALRQAMLTTMKTHPQPRDWAAFTLIGEAD